MWYPQQSDERLVLSEPDTTLSSLASHFQNLKVYERLGLLNIHTCAKSTSQYIWSSMLNDSNSAGIEGILLRAATREGCEAVKAVDKYVWHICRNLQRGSTRSEC